MMKKRVVSNWRMDAWQFVLDCVYVFTWNKCLGKYKMLKKMVAGNWRMDAWFFIYIQVYMK